jgi:hypothetical protein
MTRIRHEQRERVWTEPHPCAFCLVTTTNPRQCSDCATRGWTSRKPTDWSLYARCDECGADGEGPDSVCHDMENEPMLRTCEGRARKGEAMKAPKAKAPRPAIFLVPDTIVIGSAKCACGRAVHGSWTTCSRRLCRGDT